ncbi:hypothetical protein ACH5RR_033024 [Cinchona calisaya]|uniref:Uncharacterized protein n=1 Tax=Cinchona calisaya TaxID=153742 RepID=A0ABD2YJS5_9GENT
MEDHMGWANQPSVEELENLPSNQEVLAKQIAKSFDSDAILFSKGKQNKKNTVAGNKNNEKSSTFGKAIGGSSQNSNPIKCYRCGLKRNLILFSQITNCGNYALFGQDDAKVFDNVKDAAADVALTGERKGSLFVMTVEKAYVKKTS